MAILANLEYLIVVLAILHERNSVLSNIVRTKKGYFKCPLSPLTARYPDPNDKTCRYFFLCHRGHAFPRQCGLRWGFHPIKQECLPKNQIPEELCEYDIECGFNGYYPDPADCTKYYICFYNQPTHYGCTEGRIFDPQSSTCKTNKKRAHECSQPTPLPHFSTTTSTTTTTATTTTTTTTTPKPAGRATDPVPIMDPPGSS